MYGDLGKKQRYSVKGTKNGKNQYKKFIPKVSLMNLIIFMGHFLSGKIVVLSKYKM